MAARGRTIAMGVLLLAACRGATPDAEPGAQQTVPAAAKDAPSAGDDAMPKTSPDDADGGDPAPTVTDPSGTRGEVQGVAWALVHDDQGDRLEIHRGEERSTIAITREAEGCYVTDAAHGRWCELAELARTLILFHPNVVKPSQPK